MSKPSLIKTLTDVPNYNGEDYDAETRVLTVQIGAIIFETVNILGRWAWLARTAESLDWSQGKRKFGVIAASSARYQHQKRAERSMREFILRLAGTKP